MCSDIAIDRHMNEQISPNIARLASKVASVYLRTLEGYCFDYIQMASGVTDQGNEIGEAESLVL
jgi:hypothetical protein